MIYFVHFSNWAPAILRFIKYNPLQKIFPQFIISLFLFFQTNYCTVFGKLFYFTEVLKIDGMLSIENMSLIKSKKVDKIK